MTPLPSNPLADELDGLLTQMRDLRAAITELRRSLLPSAAAEMEHVARALDLTASAYARLVSTYRPITWSSGWTGPTRAEWGAKSADPQKGPDE